MVALAMTVICGFLALAVDLGLAYSIRKSAQSAADAAALAGVGNAFGLGSAAYGTCSPQVVCQVQTPCGPAASPPVSIDSACLYALQNGFSNSANNGYPQTVSVQSGMNVAPNSPPSAPGVVGAHYWIRVGITEQIPLFFGGIFGTTHLSVAVRSLATIVQVQGKTTVALVQ